MFGIKLNANHLNIIVPVGISFYTFQTMSYSIDVYKKKLEPTKDFIAFAAFVSFFPQLVAGPIERGRLIFCLSFTQKGCSLTTMPLTAVNKCSGDFLKRWPSRITVPYMLMKYGRITI